MIETLWWNLNFRRFIGASALAQLGSGVFSLAFPWLASLLTRDPLLIGAVAMAPQLPWLFFALPAGVWTDRLDHRRTIMVGNLIHAALALAVLALAALASPGTAAIGGLFALAFLQGSNDVLRENTSQTILPHVVPKDRLEAANAVLQTSENMMWQFAGPPLAGALIAISTALPFAFEAAMLMASALLISAVRPAPAPRAAPQSFWPALREGLGWLWANPPLRRLAMVLGAYNFLYQVIWSVMVLFALDPGAGGGAAWALAVGRGVLRLDLGSDLHARPLAGRVGAVRRCLHLDDLERGHGQLSAASHPRAAAGAGELGLSLAWVRSAALRVAAGRGAGGLGRAPGRLGAASALCLCNLGWRPDAGLFGPCPAVRLKKRGRAQGPARSNREDAAS